MRVYRLLIPPQRSDRCNRVLFCLHVCPDVLTLSVSACFVDCQRFKLSFFLLRKSNIKLFKWLPLSLDERGGPVGAVFLIIYLTSEQQSELNGPACCLFLLGSLRLHCFSSDIIFCPGLFLHGMRLLATLHANQKL